MLPVGIFVFNRTGKDLVVKFEIASLCLFNCHRLLNESEMNTLDMSPGHDLASPAEQGFASNKVLWEHVGVVSR